MSHNADAPGRWRAQFLYGGMGVQARVKLWVEKDGLLVFSDYRAELLDHIGKTGSISGGAERMGLSYRRAWGKIKEIEHNLGVRLVRSEAGGLGGGRSKLTPEGMSDRYGFSSFKLKGGAFEPDQEVAAVRALAEAFPGQPVRLDPNGAWSVPTSLRVAERLEGIAEYLEDPCAGTENMAEVARRTSLPLATNMCVTAFDEIPRAFALDAVQVVLADHHYWGGLRATQELAAICRTYGVGLSMHSNTHLGISLAAMTQVAATIPELHHACDTHRPWQSEDVITEPHLIKAGSVAVSDSPGLGVELDRDSLARLHRRWADSDVRRRDDAAAMRRFHPEWATPTLPRW